MSDELKPCPFCGNTAIEQGSTWVKCSRCMADIDCYPDFDKSAKAAWNRRTPMDDALLARVAKKLRALIAEVVEELSQYERFLFRNELEETRVPTYTEKRNEICALIAELEADNKLMAESPDTLRKRVAELKVLLTEVVNGANGMCGLVEVNLLTRISAELEGER